MYQLDRKAQEPGASSCKDIEAKATVYDDINFPFKAKFDSPQ